MFLFLFLFSMKHHAHFFSLTYTPHKHISLSPYHPDRYTHDSECVIYSGPDSAYSGHEICFNYNEDTLTIVDVTDKENMKMLSRTGYEGAKYTHQVRKGQC